MDNTTNVVGKNIATAMSEIANNINFVEKTGMNNFQNYSYMSELDLLMAVRPIMMDYGVIVYPSNIQMVSGANDLRTEAIVTYRFVHSASGEYIDVNVISAGADKGDKGAFKLMTGAMKYALRQAFMIATGDDPEAYDVDSGRRTSEETTVEHPMNKVVAAAKKRGFDLLNDEPFKSAWKELGFDLRNMSTSAKDMKFTVAVKNLVKSLDANDKEPEILVGEFVNEW